MMEVEQYADVGGGVILSEREHRLSERASHLTRRRYQWIESSINRIGDYIIRRPFISFNEIFKMLEKKWEDIDFNRSLLEEELRTLLIEYIEWWFRDFMSIDDSFEELLKENYYYSVYFTFLQRFILYFNLKYFERYFDIVEGSCIYEPEIEDPETSFPKVIFNIETRDYDLVLDLLEKFIKEQEIMLKYKFQYLTHSDKIYDQFKKTIFLFRRKR